MAKGKAAAKPRGGPKPQAPKRKGAAAFVANENFEVSDSDDDDVFAKKADKVNLNRADDVDEDWDDDLDEEVLGLSDDEDEFDEDDDDDEGDDDDETDPEDEEELLERAIARGGREAELAKQAKALGQKLKMQRKEEDEEDDEDEGGPGGKDKLWGASKRKYYDADTAELLGHVDEEAEVFRE
eukprot:CAMPEP_0202908152 /NCGR_PEP_ID=MMETSP1392-20130828/45073_1 /ASSEMBLY_ACC=CAM_ASM_000868 /TAXON_ID=225041 /ORGANISM="Chlamydomonas chlamydogama, Strain SAG 11-48b" /LENGTH=182 /DNA_ID=CAMNT_0049597341 /DNA_START=19 /DNA_END=564 /DNA_ORIENTATION=+